jgi:hypothetical protein
MALFRCNQVFKTSIQVGCSRRRKVRGERSFFIETDDAVVLCAQNEMRYSESDSWIYSSYLARQNLFANFWYTLTEVLIFDFFENRKILILRKSQRPDKVESAVSRGRRRPKNLKSVRAGHVVDALKISVVHIPCLNLLRLITNTE